MRLIPDFILVCGAMVYRAMVHRASSSSYFSSTKGPDFLVSSREDRDSREDKVEKDEKMERCRLSVIVIASRTRLVKEGVDLSSVKDNEVGREGRFG